MTGESKEECVSIKDYVDSKFNMLHELLNLQVKNIVETETEARRKMESLMEGFPEQFSKKEEVAAASRALTEIKEKDLKEMRSLIGEKLSRNDMAFQDSTTQKKLVEQDSRLINMEAIQPKIEVKMWRLGFFIVILVIILELIFKLVLKV